MIGSIRGWKHASMADRTSKRTRFVPTPTSIQDWHFAELLFRNWSRNKNPFRTNRQENRWLLWIWHVGFFWRKPTQNESGRIMKGGPGCQNSTQGNSSWSLPIYIKRWSIGWDCKSYSEPCGNKPQMPKRLIPTSTIAEFLEDYKSEYIFGR